MFKVENKLKRMQIVKRGNHFYQIKKKKKRKPLLSANRSSQASSSQSTLYTTQFTLHK